MRATSASAAVLQFASTPGLGARTLSRLLDAVHQRGESLLDVSALAAKDLEAEYSLRSEVAERVACEASSAAALAEELDTRGIHVLFKHGHRYPQPLLETLDEDAPPVLFVTGNLRLLDRPGVGFCGSRKASELGIRSTEMMARSLAEQGHNVVSGYAAGVDSAAHRAALQAGGTTTIVLAEGILHFRAKTVFGEELVEQNTVVISEFMPRSRWAAHNAMIRNNTICGLSRAVILVESGAEGGTFEAGKTARKHGIPLFVLDFAEPPASASGNRYFLNLGVPGLTVGAEGNVELRPLLDAVDQTPPSPKARTLFG